MLLLLLLKSVEVDDDVALLLSCTALWSMCTQVTLQSKLGGTGSAAVRTLLAPCWGRAVGYQPRPQVADRGTTFR